MIRLLTLVAALLLAVSARAESVSGPAPKFTLQTLEGKEVSLSDLKGQVIMINFWASWCTPCRQEMPLLNEIYDTYKKAGFTLVGINLDEDKGDAEDFLKKVPVTFPVLHDPLGAVAELYDNRAMPSSYFIDRQGKLAHLHRGYRPGEEKDYKAVIRKLIAQ